MTHEIFNAALIICAVLTGLAGGTTYAFSSFVMQGLTRLPEKEAIAAMRAINETAIGPAFLGVFMGSGLFALVLGIIQWFGPGLNPWLGAGIAIYLVGVVLVTIARNVPLNEALAASDRLTWRAYARPWMAWNHFRTGAAALASAAMVVAAL